MLKTRFFHDAPFLSSSRNLCRTNVIEQVFSFGIWAPNHHVTEPWRFTVIGEETKLILADRYREIKIEDTPDHVDAENLAKIGELAYEKIHVQADDHRRFVYTRG